ncbi:MAG: hypothetical protein IID30_05395 [Planctomycetes bacterium]|nr:hypothetical protein [Planctomycetota bacterium]
MGWVAHHLARPVAPAADIDKDIALLSSDPDFNRKCEKWFISWRRDSTGNFDSDRRSMLQLDDPVFRRGFLTLYGLKPTEHYVDFWRSLTAVGLNVFAQASEKKTDEAWAVLLDELPWFPLRALHENANLDQLGKVNSPEHRILSWSDVQRARVAMRNVRPENTSEGNGISKYKEGRIGNPGTEFKDADIDNALGKIRGKRMSPDERKRFDSLSALLLALPSDPNAQPLNCEIRYLGTADATEGRAPIYLPLPLLRVERHKGGSVKRSDFRLDRRDKPLGSEEYPGSDKLVFVFSKTSDDTDEKTVEIGGPWSVLALIHKFHGERSKKDAHIWRLEMVVPYNGTQRSFWLELTFDTPLPTLDDWPN